MINNRQGGRRRGRGGQRPPNVGGQPGNRQDNRQRGNATQLLEKYKNLARDAQLGGDRVQSEYYLQYAEHYHRVLGESRSRFDEQRRQRDDEGGSGEDDEEMAEAADEHHEQHEQRAQRPQREQRPRRSESRSNGGSRVDSDNDEDERIPLEVLPPSIGRDDDREDEAEPVAAKPRRRSRPRSDDSDDEIAPAA